MDPSLVIVDGGGVDPSTQNTFDLFQHGPFGDSVVGPDFPKGDAA